jgi:DNA-binding response OmpR family regulator
MKHLVLSIEETSSFRQMVRLALECDGFEVVDANDGKSGLDAARAMAPKLILVDVLLPDTDGLTLCKTLLADPALCSTPIVMLSSSDDESEIEAGLAAGAKGYLVKPFYPKELVALARKLIITS